MQTFPQKQQFEKIIQAISPQSKLLRVWQLHGGVSAEMTALTFEDLGGEMRKMIVRQHGNQPEQHSTALENEYRLLQTINSLGLATPVPYYLDQSRTILATPYMVIEYIEGGMLFSPVDLDDYMVQFATQLAKIHSIECSHGDLSFLSENVDICAEVGELDDLWVDEVGVQEALEFVSFLRQKNKTTLLHGDFWPGNSLWREGKLVAVIDWEDAEVGDPLIDLARSRSEIVWIFGIEAMNSFTACYQSMMSIDYTNLPYWDLCAALRLLRITKDDLSELTAYISLFGRDDIGEEAIRANLTYFIEQAFEKLV